MTQEQRDVLPSLLRVPHIQGGDCSWPHSRLYGFAEGGALGTPPQIIYAYKRTGGLLLTEDRRDHWPPDRVKE